MEPDETPNTTCTWIGCGEGCTNRPLYKKSYCEEHYCRVYTSVPDEVADYLIEDEIGEFLKT